MGLGFPKNEALVYCELVLAGDCTAAYLVKKTGLYKNGVYYSLRRLMDKGLVGSVIVDGVAHFQLEPADMLLEHVERQFEALEVQRRKASTLVSEVNMAKKEHAVDQQTHMLVGVAGVKQMHKDWLRQRAPFVSFGAPSESVEIMGEHYWKNMNLKQKELKIKGKMLFNSSLRAWRSRGIHKGSELRYLADAFEPLTQTIVFGDTVAIIVWSSKPVVTVIRDPSVARSYEQFFSLLWKQAKK
jgi:hypothetical protein